jgi:hypothetical protein
MNADPNHKIVNFKETLLKKKMHFMNKLSPQALQFFSSPTCTKK